jgi:hypothetical protein
LGLAHRGIMISVLVLVACPWPSPMAASVPRCAVSGLCPMAFRPPCSHSLLDAKCFWGGSQGAGAAPVLRCLHVPQTGQTGSGKARRTQEQQVRRVRWVVGQRSPSSSAKCLRVTPYRAFPAYDFAQLT